MNFKASKIGVYIRQGKKIYPVLLEGRINIHCVATTYQAFYNNLCCSDLVQTTLAVDITIFRWVN